MRYILIISLLISYIANSQVVADTLIFIKESGDTVKVITFTNVATSPFATSSAMNTALGLKQNTLGFTPYNATNPDGYISGITGVNVTTALGYTPLQASDIAGKQNTIPLGTTLQYFRGDLSLATFPTTTAAFTNSTNKNFVTDAQATVIGNTSGTNTGDNAANTTYANDFRAANFIAGTNYLAPNGSAANLTGFPTLNQNTTGSAATLTTPRTIQGVSFNGSANINILNGTGFVKATGTTISYDNSTYQPLATNLTAIGALANGNGFLKNNGSGTFTYENPAGSGTVTDVSVVTANGVSGSVATSTSTPAITLTLGAITPTTVNGVTITDLLPKTTTSGVGASPTASSTQTITHNLGRVPSVIRIYGYGSFTSNAAATATTSSIGIFSSSGNFCVYQRYGAAITTTQAGLSSNTFSILLATGGGNFISGVIQNVTSTQFDIVWTESGTATAQVYLWESQ